MSFTGGIREGYKEIDLEPDITKNITADLIVRKAPLLLLNTHTQTHTHTHNNSDFVKQLKFLAMFDNTNMPKSFMLIFYCLIA